MSTFELLRQPPRRRDPALLIRSDVVADGECRFKLTYTWNGAEPILPWIMLNPALAGTAREFDMTARRVVHFSNSWGFGGATLLNIVPAITPDPRDLKAWLDFGAGGRWDRRNALFRNWGMLQSELAPYDAAVVAWGRASALDSYRFSLLLECAFDAINDPDGPRRAVLKTFCLGLNGDGSPLHPMARGRRRVPDSAVPVLYGTQHGSITGLGMDFGEGAAA